MTPSSRYRTLTLANFRGFKKTEAVLLAPLTFLVGPNSSGKSSLFDALLLLGQSRFVPIGPALVPRWSGPLVDLGSYTDTVFAHNSELAIRISTDVTLIQAAGAHESGSLEPLPFHVDYVIRPRENERIGALSETVIFDEDSRYSLRVKVFSTRRIELSITGGSKQFEHVFTEEDREQHGGSPWNFEIRQFLRRWPQMLDQTLSDADKRAVDRFWRILSYGGLLAFMQGTERVASGRGGPQRWYSLGATAREVSRGRAPLFDNVDPSLLSTPDDGARSASARSASRRRQRREMNDVLKSLDIANDISDVPISPYHAAIQVTDSVTDVRSNLMEVGYGASQVIPVIRACLSSSDGPLFVEQPEIHLHPRAQGTIADLLSATSERRQVIVETHAVRMINRARIRIARGELPPEHVIINYVTRTKRGSRVSHIGIDAAGDFTSPWPGGFFDERYEDTVELLRLKAVEDLGE